MSAHEILLSLHGAKLEHVLHMANFLPGVDTYEDMGLVYGVLQNARHRAKEDKHPLRVAEVGTYSGRLGLCMSSAFHHTPDDHLFLADDFKGTLSMDPDGLGHPWKEFRKAEEVSGIDLHSMLQFHLYSTGIRDNVFLLRGSPASLGENWGEHGERENPKKLDFLVLNNLEMPYKDYLKVANAWLQWLRKGSPVFIFNTQVEGVAATVKELLSRRWPLIRQGATGMRSHAILVRPVDETSGAIGNELEEEEEEDVEESTA